MKFGYYTTSIVLILYNFKHLNSISTIDQDQFYMSLCFMKRKLIILLFPLLFIQLVSCYVHLVPNYSNEIENKIVEGAKKNDALYIKMKSVSDSLREFRFFIEDYNQIESEINSIHLLEEARPKNKDFISITDTLKTYFIKYMNEHKSKNKLEDGEIIIYQTYIKAFWKPLLKSELALRGTK
jgi:hypothetical protein